MKRKIKNELGKEWVKSSKIITAYQLGIVAKFIVFHRNDLTLNAAVASAAAKRCSRYGRCVENAVVASHEIVVFARIVRILWLILY